MLWQTCFFFFIQTLLVQDPQWASPHLLHLPDHYNIIFQYYHKKACTACKKVPKDPALCLVCGAFVCLKGLCCKQQGICECVLVSGPAFSTAILDYIWKKHHDLHTVFKKMCYSLGGPTCLIFRSSMDIIACLLGWCCCVCRWLWLGEEIVYVCL